VSAINSLKQLAVKKEYGKCTSILEIINQIITHFKPLKAVKDIAFLFETFRMIQNDLKRDIMMDFEAAYVVMIMNDSLDFYVDQ